MILNMIHSKHFGSIPYKNIVSEPCKIYICNFMSILQLPLMILVYNNITELIHYLDAQTKLRKLKDRKRTTKNSRESLINEKINDRLRNIHRKFSERIESVKSQIIRPITPETDDEGKNPKENGPKDANVKADEIKKPPDNEKLELPPQEDVTSIKVNKRICSFKLPSFETIFLHTFESRNRYYLMWLLVSYVAVMYNFLTIPLRECFEIYNYPYEKIWNVFDYVADFIYILDILLFQHRLQYLNNGIIEINHKMCAINYVKGSKFKMNVLSIIPTDLLVLILKNHKAALRLTRLFKFQTFFELFDVLDHVVKSGHIVRFVKTMSYIIYLIHFEACGYYLFSKFIGFSSDSFVFSPAPDQYSAYIYCFYWAMKTATSIGNNPSPTIYAEYCFMNVYWLSGIFVFAVLIGQIRDIFDAANANQTNYRKKMDTTILYMKNLNLSESMIKKVIMWFNYNWEHHKTLDENSLIESLPTKLKSDLAIHTHFNTLSKVSLFQDCERTLLSDLILKLRPVLFLPNDFICKKGEIGTEMYIVMTGQVEVVGGPNNSIVFATLKEGSVFGEISLLALSGGNRRTADVKSKGFSTLFSLSKQDFEEAMADYPAAYELLKTKANKVLNRHKVIENSTKKESEIEIVIPNKKDTSNLHETVLKLLENRRQSSMARDNESYCSTPSEISLHYRDSVSVTYDTKTPSPTFDRKFEFDDENFDNSQSILVHLRGTTTKSKIIPDLRPISRRLHFKNTFENEIEDDEI